jgi:uncharacterized protein (DUF924 family)
MFRDTSWAFACDPRGLRLAQDAIARGFEADLTNVERLFLCFKHAEEPQAQARRVALRS